MPQNSFACKMSFSVSDVVGLWWGAVIVSRALGAFGLRRSSVLRFRIGKPFYVIARCTKAFPSTDNKPDYNRHEEE